MSHEKAKSIVLLKDRIEITSACNNLRPLIYGKWAVELTDVTKRNFIHDLLGGMLQPFPTAQQGFWCWARQELSNRGYKWDDGPERTMEAFNLIESWWKDRADKNKPRWKLMVGDWWYIKHVSHKLWRHPERSQAKSLNYYQAWYLKQTLAKDYPNVSFEVVYETPIASTRDNTSVAKILVQ